MLIADGANLRDLIKILQSQTLLGAENRLLLA